MAQNGNRTSVILIATTLLWIVQMLISVAIKERNIFPAVEEAQESYKVVAFELLTKILGILTVMLANWLLLSCSEGIRQTVAQLVFLFLSMIFAGDYGLPVAYFLEVIYGTSKVNDDLKHFSLYKKTWSHNVVFQTGMYFLFILIIFVEQFHIYNVGRRHLPSRNSETHVSRRTDNNPALLPSTGFCPDLAELIGRYCNRNVLRISIQLVWPIILAAVIAYYTHIMKIYPLTTVFYVAILCLMIVFRCIRYKDGDWSYFYRQCHLSEDSSEESTGLQITFGIFVKVAVWGLVFLVLPIFYQELGTTASKLTQVGVPTLIVFSVVCLLIMSDFP